MQEFPVSHPRLSGKPFFLSARSRFVNGAVAGSDLQKRIDTV